MMYCGPSNKSVDVVLGEYYTAQRSSDIRRTKEFINQFDSARSHCSYLAFMCSQIGPKIMKMQWV